MPDIFRSRLFRAGIWVLLLFLIILVGTQITFIFRPLVIAIKTLFFPILIAGFLYFLTYPLVDLLQQRKVPRWASILLLYLVFLGLVALLVSFLGPLLQREVIRLVDDLPRILEELRAALLSLQNNPLFLRLMEEEPELVESVADWLTGLLGNFFTLIMNNVTYLVELITGFFIAIVTIPFILFYMLKDGHHWPRALYSYLPRAYEGDLRRTLGDMHRGISAYIQGLVVICLFVGALVYIGYLIIGLDYPLILAMFAMVTNVIPFFGPVIGIIPGLVVAALHSPLMVLKVVVVVAAVQQLESLLISPQVMGRKLLISPLTVILLVLVSGRMAGLLGMILALPSFVILKIIIVHIYKNLRAEETS